MTAIIYDKNHEVKSVDFVSPELARIVAHISGDGYVCTSTIRRGENELRIHPRIPLSIQSIATEGSGDWWLAK